MADLHFPAELPIPCIKDLIAAVRAGDYVSTTTLDHAFWALGCANALRGPQVYAASEDLSALSPAELCDRLEVELAAKGEDDAKAIPPFLWPILWWLIQKLILDQKPPYTN